MSDPDRSAEEQIEKTRARLAEIAARLRADDVGDEEAERLAREAADLAGEAGAAIERALDGPEGERNEG